MEKDNIEEIGKQAAALSLIEIGLGSVLHSFKVPLSGHILSMNQIAVLARSSFKLQSKKAPLEISIVTALLKSLSPAGKKLTPMLAIAAQGTLFYLGLLPFGLNIAGLLCAVVLAALWAFIQPVLFILMLFGQNTLDVGKYYLTELQKFIPGVEHYLISIIAGLIIVKILLALLFSIWAISLSDEKFELLHQRMIIEIQPSAANKTHSPFLLALRDLCRPLFLLSFGLSALFFIYSHTSSVSLIVWNLLRPLALGFLLFYIIRICPVERLPGYLEKKGLTQLSKTLEKALAFIQKSRN